MNDPVLWLVQTSLLTVFGHLQLQNADKVSESQDCGAIMNLKTDLCILIIIVFTRAEFYTDFSIISVL